MWRLGIALLAALALAGCGGDDGDDGDRRPPPNSRSPEETERCLLADGFDVRGAAVDTREDSDAPDHSLFVPDEAHPAVIAFYRNRARARQLLPEVRKTTERVGGALDEGGLAAVFWRKEPDEAVRDRIWRCVFAD